MLADDRRRDPASGHFGPDDVPDMRFEIQLSEGIEADRLGLAQARVLMEVVEWSRQRRSENGQGRAA